MQEQNSKAKKSLIVQVRKTCLFRSQGEQALGLLNVVTSQSFRLRGIGAFLFLKLDGRLSVGEAMDLTCAKFRLTDPEIHRAMEIFLQELFALDLVQQIPTRTEAQSWAQMFDDRPLNTDASCLTVERPPTVEAAAGGCGGCGGCYGSGGGSGSASGGGSGGGSMACST